MMIMLKKEYTALQSALKRIEKCGGEKILAAPIGRDTINTMEARQSRGKGRKTMKQISVDNGTSYTTPAEALKAVSIDTMAEYMDDDTRETVHNELAPCSDVEFLERYLELAPADLIIG